jgi:hypothetical protein
VTAATRAIWAKQAFRWERDRAAGIARLLEKRPDFPGQCRRAAALIAAVSPILANPAEASAREYADHLQQPLWVALPFLDPDERAALAARLLLARAAAGEAAP